MVKAKPMIYQKFVTIENGLMVLYVKLHKALYSFLISAVLFNKKLVSYLNSIWFIVNPYYSCVANMLANGKQMTITWHVDDLKISYVDADEVTKVIGWMNVIYGSHIKKY